MPSGGSSKICIDFDQVTRQLQLSCQTPTITEDPVRPVGGNQPENRTAPPVETLPARMPTRRSVADVVRSHNDPSELSRVDRVYSIGDEVVNTKVIGCCRPSLGFSIPNEGEDSRRQPLEGSLQPGRTSAGSSVVVPQQRGLEEAPMRSRSSVEEYPLHTEQDAEFSQAPQLGNDLEVSTSEPPERRQRPNEDGAVVQAAHPREIFRPPPAEVVRPTAQNTSAPVMVPSM